MVTLSYDPDARALYWYFTDIIAGTTVGEGECAATLLLDDAGQIVGLELELDESISKPDLVLALAHEQVQYEESTYTLTINLLGEEPAEAQPLDELAILDFDRADQLQGCEIQAAKSFGLGERLERVAAFLVDVDEDDEGFVELDEDEDADASPDDLEALDDLDDDDDELAELDELDGDGADDDDDSDDSDEDGDSDAAPPAPRRSAPADANGFRAGFVALVGRPNVGKSTLLNGILGQKIAIVSPKPQTTRMPVRGILNREQVQVVFVDTPGIHDPRTRLGTFMVDHARRAIPDADVVCFVVDISTAPNAMDRKIAKLVEKARAPKILVLNKVDQPPRRGESHLQAYRDLAAWDMEVATSASRSQGLDGLLEEIIARLPESMPLYPTDQVTDQSAREYAAELVREQVLRRTEQEVPHSVAVEVEEWEDRGERLYIRMTVYVEKESQKGIIIGAQGVMLKQIGSYARTAIAQSLGRPIFLDLWVKTRPGWRDDQRSLGWLGYHRPKG